MGPSFLSSRYRVVPALASHAPGASDQIIIVLGHATDNKKPRQAGLFASGPGLITDAGPA